MKVSLVLLLALVCAVPALAGTTAARAKSRRPRSEYARHAGAQHAGMGFFPAASFLGQRAPSTIPTPPPANGGPRPELLEGPSVDMTP